jgi:two-component system, chemotaxis family, chemotaxis protein CheY
MKQSEGDNGGGALTRLPDVDSLLSEEISGITVFRIGGCAADRRVRVTGRIDASRPGLSDTALLSPAGEKGKENTMERCMVVDDSLFQRKSLGKMIEQMGWEVVGEASNGREAVEMYERCSPDLVLMDLVMPEMEGIEAVERLLLLNRNARIVVVSSLGHDEIVEKALALGAKQFLTKPLKFGEATGILKRVMEDA